MKVLLTGGAGFIGAALANALAAQGMQIDILDDFSRGQRDESLSRLAQKPGVRVLEADLCASNLAGALNDDYELIFHLAAIVGVANVIARPLFVLRDNSRMFMNLLDAAAEMPRLSRIVLMSTSEVYAGSLQHLEIAFPTPETTPLALPELGLPRTSYMLSKIYCEALVSQSGLPFTIVRPHNVYGPRMGVAHVIPELMARMVACKAGDELVVHSPDHRRTFCFVADAIEMIARLALSSSAAGGTFNVGNEWPEVRIEELAQQILSLTGKQVRLIPGGITPGSPHRRCPDMSRTREATAYESKFPLAEGLSRTWEWYKANVFGGDVA